MCLYIGLRFKAGRIGRKHQPAEAHCSSSSLLSLMRLSCSTIPFPATTDHIPSGEQASLHIQTDVKSATLVMWGSWLINSKEVAFPLLPAHSCIYGNKGIMLKSPWSHNIIMQISILSQPDLNCLKKRLDKILPKTYCEIPIIPQSTINKSE